jgi:hypothetical protein
MILLRATDAADKCSDDRYDMTRIDPNNQSTTMALVTTGLRKMENMVKTHVNRSLNGPAKKEDES